MNRTRYWRVLGLGAIVSLIVLAFLVANINFSQLWAALQGARYGFLVPASALIVLGLFTRALRWRAMLLNALPIRRAFNILNVSYLINGVVPFRAGELARAWLATRHEPPVPMFQSLSTIVVERLLDTLAVLIILALALSGAPLPDALRTAAAMFVPGVAIGLTLFIAMSIKRDVVITFATSLSARYSILARWRLVGLLEGFLNGLLPLTMLKPLLWMLGWTVVSWGFSLASGYVLMYAFYPQGNWAAVALFTAAASFAVAVPAVPGNIGPYEASVVLSLQAMGMGDPFETAVAFAVLLHGLNLLLFALLGMLGLLQEGVTVGQLSQGLRGAQREGSPAA